VADLGRRERKKLQARQRISDVATALFAARGFDDVSISEIADAADVSRATVFAHFPRKEDLVFDRTAAVTEALRAAAASADGAPVDAVLRVLAAPVAPEAPGPASAAQRDFFRLVASSRALQARARELAEEMESVVADALGASGVVEPEMVAALIAAAYRTAHLHAIRRLLRGAPARAVERERAVRLAGAFAAIKPAIAQLQRTGRAHAATGVA
jgi:AcrR family transcriptional regulator